MSFSTESIARASGQRPWLVIGIWIAVLVGAMAANATLLSGALTRRLHHVEQP